MVTLIRIITALALLAFSLTSAAAVVTSVKGDKALINLEGSETVVGEEFYLVNPTTNKKKAIIRIKQIKQGRAVADVVKGKAENGFTLQLKMDSAAGHKAAEEEEAAPAASSSHKKSPYATASGTRSAASPQYLKFAKDSWGIMAEYMNDTMIASHSWVPTTGIPINATAHMTGSGFGVGGFYDYAYSNEIIFEGLGAIEQFNVAGASSQMSAGDCNCNAKIQYLSGYGIAKYNFTEGHYRAWVGAGGGLLMTMSQSSNILVSGSTSVNETYLIEVGVDIQLSRKNYIPLALQYEAFPASPSVNANMITLKAGWAWNL